MVPAIAGKVNADAFFGESPKNGRGRKKNGKNLDRAGVIVKNKFRRSVVSVGSGVLKGGVWIRILS
jgi:hypothetical protein